jgi:hypothetical protein
MKAIEITFNKKFWEELITYFLWYDMDHIENDVSNSYSIVPCLIVAAVTFLPSRSPVTIGWYTYRCREWRDGFMKYAVEMGSGAMIYIASFVKFGWGIRKLIWRIHRHTDSMEIAKVYFYFFNIKKVGYIFSSYIIGNIHIPITKPSWLMLLREIIAVYSDIHTKPISILILSGQNVVFYCQIRW